MKLAGDEKRVLGQLDDLHQLAVGCVAAENEIRFLEALAIRIVELVSVTVALVDYKGAVQARRFGGHHQLARLGAEAHRAAFLGHSGLLVQHGDDRVRCVGVKLSRVGFGEFQHVAREFDGGDLHAQAQAQIGHVVLAGVARGLDFAFDAAPAKAARHEDAAQALQVLLRAVAFEIL